MNENIDLTKILKDCPKGFKLYSTIFGPVTFVTLDLEEDQKFQIIVQIVQNETEESFTREGKYLTRYRDAECLLFPSKNQRDWNKFSAPWYKNSKFKDGDIVAVKGDSILQVFILQIAKSDKNGYCYIGYDFKLNKIFHAGRYEFDRFATEEEKQKLFNAIKENGYRWDAKTKTLYKVEPKFKVGDWLCANELNNYANFIKIVKIVNVFGKKRYKISRDYDSDLDLTKFDFIEKHYHLFTIKDAKDGDVLVSKHNQPFIYNGNYNNYEVGAYCGIECTGKQFIITCSEIHWTFNKFIKPATKEQHDTLMKAMNDAGYEWDAEKKELKKKK